MRRRLLAALVDGTVAVPATLVPPRWTTAAVVLATAAAPATIVITGGASPGHLAAGLRVVRSDGRRASRRRLLLRGLAEPTASVAVGSSRAPLTVKQASLAIGTLSVASSLWTRGIGCGDRVAGTRLSRR